MVDEDWKKAGEIIARIARRLNNIVKPGKTLLEIAETIENEIRKQGASLAFPVNISVDAIAAHYTPSYNDISVLQSNSVVKVDMGACVNGALSDMAITIYLGSSKKIRDLLTATKEALNNAISIIRDGIRVNEVSKVIWDTAHQYNFGVLVDLGGHNLKRWQLHGGIMIPNAPSNDIYSRKKIREGMVIAIEPFLVLSSKDSRTIPLDFEEIYSLIPRKNFDKSKLLRLIWERYKTLPFAMRWLIPSKRNKHKDKFLVHKLKMLLDEYREKGYVVSYPALKDVNNFIVAQFEHTLYVKRNSAEILSEV